MVDFNMYGEIALTAGGAENFLPAATALVAVPAHQQVMLRRVICNYTDGVAGNAQFIITVTDAVTAAVLALWRTILALGGAGTATSPIAGVNPDRAIYFQSGNNGANIQLSANAANANATLSMAVSGRYNRS